MLFLGAALRRPDKPLGSPCSAEWVGVFSVLYRPGYDLPGICCDIIYVLFVSNVWPCESRQNNIVITLGVVCVLQQFHFFVSWSRRVNGMGLSTTNSIVQQYLGRALWVGGSVGGFVHNSRVGV